MLEILNDIEYIISEFLYGKHLLFSSIIALVLLDIFLIWRFGV